jgi:hypothetical protein
MGFNLPDMDTINPPDVCFLSSMIFINTEMLIINPGIKIINPRDELINP